MKPMFFLLSVLTLAGMEFSAVAGEKPAFRGECVVSYSTLEPSRVVTTFELDHEEALKGMCPHLDVVFQEKIDGKAMDFNITVEHQRDTLHISSGEGDGSPYVSTMASAFIENAGMGTALSLYARLAPGVHLSCRGVVK